MWRSLRGVMVAAVLNGAERTGSGSWSGRRPAIRVGGSERKENGSPPNLFTAQETKRALQTERSTLALLTVCPEVISQQPIGANQLRSLIKLPGIRHK